MMKYFTRVTSDNNFDEIEVDLDFYHTLGESKKVFSLWVFVKGDKTTEYQDELIEVVQKKHKADFAAKKTSDGWNEYYFYADSEKGFTTNINDFFAKKASNFTSSIECGSHKDAKFKGYLENIYPSELEFHQIESRHIIETLVEEGDSIENERVVEHYAFFQTEANLSRFVDNAQAIGFSMKELVNNEEAEYAYGVVLIKKHSVLLESIQEQIADLLEKIYLEHGYYEGWSTALSVVPSTQEIALDN